MADLSKKITTETLLMQLPTETGWAITAKTLTSFIVSRMLKTSTPFLGKDDGILSLLSGWEKEVEIKAKIYAEGARKMFPFIKETFNIPVEDAVGAANLLIVAATLMNGPETKFEIVEETPERVLVRWHKCVWMERWFKDFGTTPELIPCPKSDKAWGEAGLHAVNPNLTYKVIKAMPQGDSYCKTLIEFKEE